jgi:hypothetical protein
MEKLALCQLGHLEEGDPVELGELKRRVPIQDYIALLGPLAAIIFISHRPLLAESCPLRRKFFCSVG